MRSVCEFCRHVKHVVSGTGSHFLMCRKAQDDKRFPKYPRQPVLQCTGFERPSESGSTR